MNTDKLKKPYDSKIVEKNIYDIWEASGFFNPDNLLAENIKLDENGKEKTYTIINT